MTAVVRWVLPPVVVERGDAFALEVNPVLVVSLAIGIEVEGAQCSRFVSPCAIRRVGGEITDLGGVISGGFRRIA